LLSTGQKFAFKRLNIHEKVINIDVTACNQVDDVIVTTT